MDRFLNIFFNFNGAKMVNHILEFSRILDLDEFIDSSRILINSDDIVMPFEGKTIKSRHLIPIFIGTRPVCTESFKFLFNKLIL